jgi:hypothetical protein
MEPEYSIAPRPLAEMKPDEKELEQMGKDIEPLMKLKQPLAQGDKRGFWLRLFRTVSLWRTRIL